MKVVILGLGADGHTASLFPGATAFLPGGDRVPVEQDMPGVAAAVEAGASQVQVTVNGLGERAGNADLAQT